jgi:hypothetical protein
MSDTLSVQPFFTSQKRVSRGFHRLGILLGLTTLVIFLIIGAQQYDPISWWVGGVLVALMVYGLSRLAGWTINGFTESDVTPPNQVQPPATQSAPVSRHLIAAEPARSSVEVAVARGERILEPSWKEPKGLGGWLILPVLGLMLAPFKMGAVTIQVAQTLFGLPSTADASVKLLLIGEIIANSILFALAIYALVKLKGQKKAFPLTYIALFGSSIIVMLADLLCVYFLFDVKPDATDMRNGLATVIMFGIWAPYMLYSKRVANTFVN